MKESLVTELDHTRELVKRLDAAQKVMDPHDLRINAKYLVVHEWGPFIDVLQSHKETYTLWQKPGDRMFRYCSNAWFKYAIRLNKDNKEFKGD